jgi:RNA polymerase sigma factor (TIGR02999 family)
MQSTISSLIGAAERGDCSAVESLFTALYEELHRLAEYVLTGHPALSISATTLLHEAYLGMAAHEGQCFPDRARFMSYAGRVMRGLIVDHTRNRQAQKRGGQFELTPIETEVAPSEDREVTLISDALDELERMEPALAEVVELKFFCGLSFEEIAAIQCVSGRTVQRKWDKARIYLYRSIRAETPSRGADA